MLEPHGDPVMVPDSGRPWRGAGGSAVGDGGWSGLAPPGLAVGVLCDFMCTLILNFSQCLSSRRLSKIVH